jgi:hypothetical protein
MPFRRRPGLSLGIIGRRTTSVFTLFPCRGRDQPPARTLLNETLPYIFGRIRGLENLCVSNVDDLPQAARVDKQYLEQSGIRSFMVIPLLSVAAHGGLEPGVHPDRANMV